MFNLIFYKSLLFVVTKPVLHVRTIRYYLFISSWTLSVVIGKLMASSIFVGTGKGKGYSRAAHEGPEGEQRYSYNLSLT
jgi:hypothetical protein